MGTALGLALTGLLFSANGGVTGSPARADHAFTVTALVLAAIAAGAGIVAGLPWRSGAGPGRPTVSTTLRRRWRARCPVAIRADDRSGH